MNRPIFSADDWGLSPGVNAGILALADHGLLHSVSCLGNGEYLDFGLAELLKYPTLKYSIHFNFTYGRPMGEEPFYPLKSLIMRGLSRRIKTGPIALEFQLQLQRLREHGVPVSGVNGHHHIHLLPFVFCALRSHLLEENLRSIRLMRDSRHFPSYWQTRIFERFCFDANAFSGEDCHYLRPRDLVSAESFAGVVSAGKIFLAHPALYDDFEALGVADSLSAARVAELNAVLRFASCS